MKSFNVDYMLHDEELIRKAIIKTCKSKKKRNGRPNRKYLQAQEILKDIDEYAKIMKMIISDTDACISNKLNINIAHRQYPLCFHPHVSGSFNKLCDNGKIRKITTTNLFPDQVIHTMICLILEKVLVPSFYTHTCGSIPGRGIDSARKFLRKRIFRNAYNSKIKYWVQLDIKKCYAHVRHSYLKNLLRNKFRGYLFYEICRMIIDSYHEYGDWNRGLPIGFCTSQWFCNFYLNDLDHIISQDLKCHNYVRYVDDMVFSGPNKKYLHFCVNIIRDGLHKLGMELKPNWQVFRFDYFSRKTGKRCGKALDVLGYRFYRDKVIMRKRRSLKLIQATHAISSKPFRRISLKEAKSYMSRVGVLKKCNSYGFTSKYIKPNVNLKAMRKMIGIRDKKVNTIRKELKIQNG